ncbi:ribosome maturation factor RimM [soil metagenome]
MSSTSEGKRAAPEVVVGRIGKAHGIKGEVSVEPRTDEPERRFSGGAVLVTRTPRGAEPHATDRPATLRVLRTRWHLSRLLVTFEGVADRTAAEKLRGLSLVLDLDPDEVPADPEEFYDHQLVGLAVATTDGVAVGEVTDVIHGASQDLLAIRTSDGSEVLVPFVSALVPVVDVPGRRLEIADRPGLLTPLPDED